MKKILCAAVALAAFSTAATAAIVTDPVSGAITFIGKGDVQLALSLNNKQLQETASTLDFRVLSTSSSDSEWVCTNSKNENMQERSRTTTTESSIVLTAIARDGKKQITGFNVTGAGSSSSSSSTEGPELNSCPSGKDWSLTSSAITTPGESYTLVQVSADDGSTWVDLI
jgi:opacity protein-like surface antigen